MFLVYNIVIPHLCTLRSDLHDKSNYHLSPVSYVFSELSQGIIVIKILFVAVSHTAGVSRILCFYKIAALHAGKQQWNILRVEYELGISFGIN